MGKRTAKTVKEAVSYIEEHLDGKLTLPAVAEGIHYSKYHLHRMFRETTGMTMHDYILRRQMTEAAKLLVFSRRPVIEIGYVCGYESQQAFTAAFTAMYKIPPAEYRRRQTFYPLQLRFWIREETGIEGIEKSDVRLAEMDDIPEWMELVRLVIDGYPYLDETDYIRKLKRAICQKRALILEKKKETLGVLCFSRKTGEIEFLGVHPQYRNVGIQRLFLEVLLETYLPEQKISITTYRRKDRADTGYRRELLELGFAERELLVEYGYPVQRFVYPPDMKEDTAHANTTGKETTF